MECSKARNFRFLEHVFLLEFTSPKIEYLRNYALIKCGKVIMPQKNYPKVIIRKKIVWLCSLLNILQLCSILFAKILSF